MVSCDIIIPRHCGGDIGRVGFSWYDRRGGGRWKNNLVIHRHTSHLTSCPWGDSYQAVMQLAHTHTRNCVIPTQSHFIAQYSCECYLYWLHFWTCFFREDVLPPPGLTQLSHILEHIPQLQSLKNLKEG